MEFKDKKFRWVKESKFFHRHLYLDEEDRIFGMVFFRGEYSDLEIYMPPNKTRWSKMKCVRVAKVNSKSVPRAKAVFAKMFKTFVDKYERQIRERKTYKGVDIIK